jgi:hypothetical protein
MDHKIIQHYDHQGMESFYEKKGKGKIKKVGEHFLWYRLNDRPFFYWKYNANGVWVEEACWYDNGQLATYTRKIRGKPVHYERYDWHGNCLNYLVKEECSTNYEERKEHIGQRCASEWEKCKLVLTKNSN